MPKIMINVSEEDNDELHNVWKSFNELTHVGRLLKAIHDGETIETDWIPVTERLPKRFTFVNATCRSLVDDREDWVIETLYLPIPQEYNPRHYSDWGNIPMLNNGEAEVIAWVERFIPEPYKAEEQDNAKDNN